MYNMYPKVKIQVQYLKDLSFESPNAPMLFFDYNKSAPKISANIDVTSTKFTYNQDQKEPCYEVVLHIIIKASIIEKEKESSDNENKIAFICEIKYGGLLFIENHEKLEEEEVKCALLVVAPSMLFPFAREIISKATSNGGFPPLMLDPMDFEEICKKQFEKQENKEVIK